MRALLDLTSEELQAWLRDQGQPPPGARPAPSATCPAARPSGSSCPAATCCPPPPTPLPRGARGGRQKPPSPLGGEAPLFPPSPLGGEGLGVRGVCPTSWSWAWASR